MSATELRSQVEQLIDALALKVGDPELALDASNACYLGDADRGGTTLIFMEGDGAAVLMLATVVGLLGFENREPFLREALRANLYWRGTNGATLSLGPRDDVLLHQSLDVDASLDMVRLEQTLEALLETAVTWGRYLQSLEPNLPDLT